MQPSSTARGIARRRPTGLAAWLLRLPVVLYAHGVGWLLGYRFVQITHRGRRSGRIYRSVVEVARFDRTGPKVVVVSAWRGETDWYRNIRAQPALEIRTGRLRFTPEQRLLTPEESFREMDLYMRHHRVAARLMPWLFGIDLRGSREEAREQIEDFFRGVSFSPPVRT